MLSLKEVPAMSSMQITIVVIVVVVVLFLAVGAVYLSRRRALQARFGPEYDRVVSEQDSRAAGERETARPGAAPH
jgi:flagellar basal body-associated protein FliL